MKCGYSDKKCGLIGERLEHSFSVPIHNELADYSFVLREVERDRLDEFMRGNEFDAFCVTIPYKKDVIPYLSTVSPEAQAIGAVNVVVRDDKGKLHGYNTDYFGFDYMIDAVGIDVRGKKALVLGKGGASLTVCAVLGDRGVKDIVVLGSKDNTPENIAKHTDAHIIVNASPVGMYPNNGVSPIDLSLFTQCEAVLDLIYNPARTALVLEAERLGITAVSGLSMLVAQAARGFEHITGDPYEEGCIERIISKVGRDTRNVILIGMPGCGKSTVGKILADKLGREFFDADDEFCAMHSITPAQAISTLGEDTFRLMEHETLKELCKRSRAVISTGGGAVTREYNYGCLHQNSVIIFLERELDKLSTSGRPLSQSTSVEELYAKRKDSYLRFADIRVKSTEIPERNADAMIEALSGYDYTCVFKNAEKN